MNGSFQFRMGAIVLVAACLSCSVGSSGGTTGFGTGQTSISSGDGDGDATDETTGDDTGSASNTDDSSSSSSSTTDDSSSSTSSTTDPTSSTTTSSSTGGGGQPDSGMYSHCLDAQACMGFGCLTIGDPVTDGFCTEECAGNPGVCDPAPQDSNAVPACIVVSGYNLCALDCTGNKTCPAGMVCGGVMTDNGAIDLCY